ncbi:hypothetical protein GCM10020366_19210 [Saccharopolyspora gregorii]|uniref:DUF397 domain-containing protein n=2 Tax=Saccharopolyspora gregorii TaxID=33914 RepID=A0ABP6RL17_9PSEU|nr:hypothetical protein [Saccharopolyspora gregorii]
MTTLVPGIDDEPQREWLCRCSVGSADVAMCEIGVIAGDVELRVPDGEAQFRLSGNEIAVFRRSLDEAIEVAAADRARRRTGG